MCVGTAVLVVALTVCCLCWCTTAGTQLLEVCRPFEGTEGTCGPFVFPQGPLATARRPSAPRSRRSRAKATRARGPTRVWRDAAAVLKPPATLARETRKLSTPYLLYIHTHVDACSM